MVADLNAVREIAQVLLHTPGTLGHGAALLGLVGNAEREMARLRAASALAPAACTDLADWRIEEARRFARDNFHRPDVLGWAAELVKELLAERDAWRAAAESQQGEPERPCTVAQEGVG